MRKPLILLIALLLLSATVVHAQAEARWEPTRCPFEEPDGTDPECGYLIVPEDHFDSDNENTIELMVAIFEATGDDPADDPLIYLEGGPGGSPLEFIQFSWEDLFAPFNEAHTLVIFDQRGVGYSRPALDCEETVELTFETLDDDLEADDALEMYIDALTECRERLADDGVNFEVFNSAQSAADIAALREVLEYEQVNLYGISYGTRLALTAMRDFGDEGWIRSVIIDSVAPPEVIGALAPVNFYRALEVMFAACEAEEACSESYPDLREVFFDLVDQLNEDPIVFEVQLFDVESGTFDGSTDVLIDGYGLISTVQNALYSENYIPQLPEAIYDLRDGDTNFFSLFYTNLLAGIDQISEGMNYAVRCNEEIPFIPEDEVAEQVGELPEVVAEWADFNLQYGGAGDEFCADVWQSGTADVIENEAVVSDIPTLVAAGKFDPITPPSYAQLAAESLSNSTYIEVPNAAHGAIQADECSTAIAIAFLEDPTEELDTSCLSDIEPLVFETPGMALAMQEIESDDLGVRVEVPEAWSEQDAGEFDVLGDTLFYANDGGDQAILIVAAGGSFADPDLVLEALSGGSAEALDPLETDAAEWEIYTYAIEGSILVVDTAFSEIDGTTYYVFVFATDEATLEELRLQVLYPALESFEFTD